VGDDVPDVVAKLHSVLAPPDMQRAWKVVAAAFTPHADAAEASSDGGAHMPPARAASE
jgi:hypothetical protein